MVEGNEGRKTGQGGLTGPLSARERSSLFLNDERVDHSGYPKGFAPDTSSAEPEGISREKDENLGVGMTMVNNPHDPGKVYEELEKLRRKRFRR